MDIKLIIDDKEIKAKSGEKILWTALDNGIYIPNLCAIKEMEPPFGGCRLCFVEIELNGEKTMTTACSEPVQDKMRVFTNTERVRRLQLTAFELLMSDHEINCPECLGKENCQLLKIAGFLKIKLKPKRFRKLERNLMVDNSNSEFILDPNKCVKCGKCISESEKQGNKLLTFAYRGIDMIISTFDNMPLAELNKDILRECAVVCPTGALKEIK